MDGRAEALHINRARCRAYYTWLCFQDVAQGPRILKDTNVAAILNAAVALFVTTHSGDGPLGTHYYYYYIVP